MNYTDITEQELLNRARAARKRVSGDSGGGPVRWSIRIYKGGEAHLVSRWTDAGGEKQETTEVISWQREAR
jgi:hypothetical protein